MIIVSMKHTVVRPRVLPTGQRRKPAGIEIMSLSPTLCIASMRLTVVQPSPMPSCDITYRVVGIVGCRLSTAARRRITSHCCTSPTRGAVAATEARARAAPRQRPVNLAFRPRPYSIARLHEQLSTLLQ